jgi:tetratricopeptide (TPR) repeat protein
VSSNAKTVSESWVDLAELLAQARVLERTGARHDAESAYDALIVAAARQENQAVLSEAFRHRAVLAHQAGDSARARSYLRQSYAAATLIADHRLSAEALNTLGGLELETRNLAAAELALTEAAALASKDAAVLARVSQNLGIVANIRGDHAAAQSYYERSLTAYETLEDQHGSAIARHNLGMLSADRGDHLQASAHFQACERLAEASGNAHLQALCLVNHAEVMLALGDVSEARSALETAGKTLEALGAEFDAPDVLRVLALCDRADGLTREAEERLVRARQLARAADARLTEAEVDRDLGRLYAETGRLDEAEISLDHAVRTFAELGAALDADSTGRELASLTRSR